MKEREIQWPCSELSQPGKKRRYEREAFPTSDGKARFIPVLSIGPADQTDKNFPLILTTGRISSQWHSRTRTGKVAYLIRNAKDPFIEIHPQDAVRRDINQGNWVEISSRYGFAKARAKITREISRGVLFFPFHWGDSRDEASAANYLFSSTADPSTGQPEYKYTAVELRPWNKKNEDLRRQN